MYDFLAAYSDAGSDAGGFAHSVMLERFAGTPVHERVGVDFPQSAKVHHLASVFHGVFGNQEVNYIDSEAVSRKSAAEAV